jgi:hypothetical protein
LLLCFNDRVNHTCSSFKQHKKHKSNINPHPQLQLRLQSINHQFNCNNNTSIKESKSSLDRYHNPPRIWCHFHRNTIHMDNSTHSLYCLLNQCVWRTTDRMSWTHWCDDWIVQKPANTHHQHTNIMARREIPSLAFIPKHEPKLKYIHAWRQSLQYMLWRQWTCDLMS